jgi:DNA-directed RNA polymerase subunit RPC12/RpoP
VELKNRIRRLEGRRKPERCPECAGRILLEEHHEDGTVSYPDGDGPCLTCNNVPPASLPGRIEIIEVVLGEGGRGMR